MRRWARDRTAIDVRLLGYRDRRNLDALNRRYERRWWHRWRRRGLRFLGPELVPVLIPRANDQKWRRRRP